MPYASGSTSKLFAASGTAFYDCTTAGAVGAAVVTGLANARFQSINMANVGVNYLLCVNGVDKLQGYTGSAWYKDGDGTHDITGVNTTGIGNICLFKQRVWLTSNTDLTAYYLGTNAISGAVSTFPLQGVFKLGGTLVSAATWTIDAGYGADDNLVFVTSKGEVAVYSGTDPTTVSTFGLIGVWQLGAPVGNRCLQKYGGDLLYISQDGLTPLSQLLQSDRLDPRVSLTNKIQYAVSNAVTSYGSTFGWDVNYYAKNNMLVLNVPLAVGSQQQYVMNTITQAWANFTGWNANCFMIWKDLLYFGGSGVVCKAWDTTSDNGTNIVCDAKQAFSFAGSPVFVKRFTLMRPYIVTNGGTPGLQAAINVDFDDSYPYGSGGLSPTPSPYGVWGSSLWGSAIFGSAAAVQKNWQGIVGEGYSFAPRLKAVVNGLTVQWMATDIVYEQGSIL